MGEDCGGGKGDVGVTYRRAPPTTIIPGRLFHLHKAFNSVFCPRFKSNAACHLVDGDGRLEHPLPPPFRPGPVPMELSHVARFHQLQNSSVLAVGHQRSRQFRMSVPCSHPSRRSPSSTVPPNQLPLLPTPLPIPTTRISQPTDTGTFPLFPDVDVLGMWLAIGPESA